MVVLPSEFVATRYPGYFWNTDDKKLYSIKVTGELKPLKFCPGGQYGRHTFTSGYRISHRGEKRTMSMDYLSKLKSTTKRQVIPVQQVLF